jgi:hypothetical protein
MTIRTGGAQQVGDAAVAGCRLGGGDRFHVHVPPFPTTHGGFGADYMSKPWREVINSGEPPSGCGFSDQALQRGAHRVVNIGGGEVGAAELQLGDEAHEKYSALLYR